MEIFIITQTVVIICNVIDPHQMHRFCQNAYENVCASALFFFASGRDFLTSGVTLQHSYMAGQK